MLRRDGVPAGNEGDGACIPAASASGAPPPMPSNRVHLCVDMQRMFVEATPWHIETMAATLPGIEALVERAPESTVFTRFIPPPPETVRGAWIDYYAAWPQMAGDRVPAELLELT